MSKKKKNKKQSPAAQGFAAQGLAAQETRPADTLPETEAEHKSTESSSAAPTAEPTPEAPQSAQDADVPTTEDPTAEAPTAEAPPAEAPTAEAPTAEVPTAEVPPEEAPAAEEVQKPKPIELTEEEKAALRRDNTDFAFLDETKNNPYKNVFVDSLESVTADDLGKPPKKEKHDPVDLVIDLFRKAIFWVAVVAFFAAGYQLVYKLYAYKQAEDIYNFDPLAALENRREDLVAAAAKDSRMQSLAPVNGTREESAEISDAAGNNTYNETFEMMKGQLLILRNKNPEVIGWIRMEGDTDINYPLVQHDDNDHYLHYAYNGAYNPAGSIFLDYKNNAALSKNRHSIIYGHNMESGSPMFANLLHYQEDGFWEKNRYIEIYTDDAFYTYEVFAAYETNPSQTIIENHAWRMNFNKDDAVFMAWLDAIRQRSDISPNVKLDANSRILTLSTCMNVNENRYVVHAVLTEVVK